jgi:hypothetical protein
LTRALVEAWFHVTGIDASSDLLALARVDVPRARFVNASIYDVHIPACEAIIAVGEFLTYHAEGADADRLVQDASTSAGSATVSLISLRKRTR